MKIFPLLVNKYRGARLLGQLIRLTANWSEVWRYRRHVQLLPPLRLRNGFTLNHGKDDDPFLLFDEVFVKRIYEGGTAAPPNGIMVDIGANIGAVTLFWAASSGSLRIHAYEPNPSAFEMLQRNVKENSLAHRVEMFPEAVGRATGELNLWVDVETALSTGYLESSPSPFKGGRRITVPMIGMDELWRRLNNEPIWLLKVDTEGAEVDILEGASPVALQAVQNVIVECHDAIYPEAYKRSRRVLEASGFQCRAIRFPWNEAIIYARR